MTSGDLMPHREAAHPALARRAIAWNPSAVSNLATGQVNTKSSGDGTPLISPPRDRQAS